MLKMRLDGYTYQYIAGKTGVSRQRVQQLLSPPKVVRKYIVNKYGGQCIDCGIFVGRSGHIHHNNMGNETYEDIDNLILLCISCHRMRHKGENGKAFTVRLPEPLARTMRKQAIDEGRRVNEIIKDALEDYMKNHKIKGEK